MKSSAQRILFALSNYSLLLAAILLWTPTSRAFSGDFLVSNVYVDTSPDSGVFNHSNYIYFTFTDQDTLQLAPVPCLIFWSPLNDGSPSSGTSLCANSTFKVNVPDARYSGAQDFEVELSHTYLDASLGEYPYNILTKFGGLNLSWPDVEGYDCDGAEGDDGGGPGRCWSETGVSFLAVVTKAIS